MEKEAYVARQPIVDSSGNLVAYELLFRSGAGAQSAQFTGGQLQATATLLENVLNSMGIDKIAGNKKVFINCSREMIISGALNMLDKERFVLEILETVSFDEQTLEAVEAAHASGFEIALDDIVFEPSILQKLAPVLKYAKYAKIDLTTNTKVQRKMAASFFKAKGIIPLAEKVENEKEAKGCEREGYELFQGYFFSKPETMSSNKLDMAMASILNMLSLLRRNPETHELEQEFKRYPDMTVNLLRYINSAYMATYHEITSIRQALTLVGQGNLKHWLTLLLFARTGLDEANDSPLFYNAMQRAIVMEKLALTMKNRNVTPDEAFLVGIMSHIDALCKAPMVYILSEIDLGDNINYALLNEGGELGKLLKLMRAIETDVYDNVEMMLNELNLPYAALVDSMMEAFSTEQPIN
ncbi:MAG: HDOD domain-containing protein [Chitinispirillia bacterium]|nr:HDOD domain-containing protein [Chitinispirillia bacterium]